MFNNNLKIAWRNLWKNKGYSLLNIFGLTIGVTCAAMILLWVEDEVGYDKNFAKQDVVYYVPTNQQYDGEWRTFFEATPGPLAEVLKAEVPGIVGAARTKGEDLLFRANEISINKRPNVFFIQIIEDTPIHSSHNLSPKFVSQNILQFFKKFFFFRFR